MSHDEFLKYPKSKIAKYIINSTCPQLIGLQIDLVGCVAKVYTNSNYVGLLTSLSTPSKEISAIPISKCSHYYIVTSFSKTGRQYQTQSGNVQIEHSYPIGLFLFWIYWEMMIITLALLYLIPSKTQVLG